MKIFAIALLALCVVARQSKEYIRRHEALHMRDSQHAALIKEVNSNPNSRLIFLSRCSYNISWKAGVNLRFWNMTMKDIRGQMGVLPNSPIKLPVADIQVAADLPDSFDARVRKFIAIFLSSFNRVGFHLPFHQGGP